MLFESSSPNLEEILSKTVNQSWFTWLYRYGQPDEDEVIE